jgi:hypothetical protein
MVWIPSVIVRIFSVGYSDYNSKKNIPHHFFNCFNLELGNMGNISLIFGNSWHSPTFPNGAMIGWNAFCSYRTVTLTNHIIAMKLMALCILAATVMLAFVQFDKPPTADRLKQGSVASEGMNKNRVVKDSTVHHIDPLTGKIDTLYSPSDTAIVALL